MILGDGSVGGIGRRTQSCMTSSSGCLLTDNQPADMNAQVRILFRGQSLDVPELAVSETSVDCEECVRY